MLCVTCAKGTLSILVALLTLMATLSRKWRCVDGLLRSRIVAKAYVVIIVSFFVRISNSQTASLSDCYCFDSIKKFENSSKLRCNTLPTFKCSSYIDTIVGLILRLSA